VVEDVESLEAELNHVAFFIRHMELLAYAGIESNNPRTQNGIAPGIASEWRVSGIEVLEDSN
jgi:hypothetical protein